MHESPFKSLHESHDARFIEFAGWHMPLHYGSVIDEHKACRQAGAMFDVSHMARVYLKGRHVRRFLETVLSRRITDMKDNTCRYTMICNDQGGVMDDVIVYRFEDRWMIVVNAANRSKILEHFERVKAEGEFTLDIDDRTEQTAMVALQGPHIMDKVASVSKEVPSLKKYHFCEKNLMVVKMTISRTGYTGEDGIEIVLGAKQAEAAVKLFLKDDQVTLAGLAARDTLRMEAGLPLYGHELGEQTDPLSAGLGFAVTLDKDQTIEGPDIPRFIGQDALERIKAEGPPRQLRGLKLDGRRTPRQGMEVLSRGQSIGQVTSGCLSPTLGQPIAIASLTREAMSESDTVQINFGKKTTDATVTKLPFYRRE